MPKAHSAVEFRGRRRTGHLSLLFVRAVSESLEPRRLLSGTIAGTIWNDANANGIWDDPNGLSGWKIDLVRSGAIVQQAISNTWGKFWFVAPAGTYTIKPEPLSGFWPTNTTGAWTFTLADGQTLGPAFGFTNGSGGTITGSVFNDVNNNGVEDGNESGLSGWTVYLDQNYDGQLDSGDPTSVTDSAGNFSFGRLVAGTYAVRIAAPPGYHCTAANIAYATAMNGTSMPVPGFGYASGTGVTLYGMLFNDLNDDGVWSTGEPAISGLGVDVLQNGALVRTTSTDSVGMFNVTMSAGTYTLRPHVPAGYRATNLSSAGYTITLADGQSTGNPCFGLTNAPGGTISGTIFSDANSNGILDAGEAGLSGWKAYIDLNGNGRFDPGEPTTTTNSAGGYSFTQLVADSYSVGALPSSDFHATGSGFVAASVSNGQISSGNNLAYNGGSGVTLYGMLFNDLNDDGTWSTGEPALTGWPVDLLQNGTLLRTAPTNAVGMFSFSEPAGAYSIRPEARSGYRSTNWTSGYTVTLADGQSTGNPCFGYTTAPGGSITGTVFSDANGNGVFDAGDSGLAEWTVYLDSNNNGQLDPGEPTAIATANGTFTFTQLVAGTYTVRIVQQANTRQTLPTASSYTVAVSNGTTSSGNDFGFASGAPVTIAGQILNDANASGIWNGQPGLGGWTVYLDANNNGQLDPGEMSTTTNFLGWYTFTQLLPGTYTVCYVRQPGWYQTFPIPDHLTMTLAAGQISTGDNFGVTTANGTISGHVVNDLGGTGLYSTADPAIPHWGVYIDANHNGRIDPGEPWTVTDATGSFTFTHLTAGSYNVAVDPQYRGWSATSPAQGEVTIVSDGLHASTPLTFLYHQNPPPAQYDVNHVVDVMAIGGTSTNDAYRDVGYTSLQTQGWSGFIAQNVQPEIAWGVRRIELDNPFGNSSNNSIFEADQYLLAQASGLGWLTNNFVSAWQPVTASGVEVIAYIGSPYETASFQALLAAGDTAGWMARFNASVAPLVQAHMSIGIDHSAGMPRDSLLWQAVTTLQAQGVKIYIESRPAEPTTYLWNLPTISADVDWINGDPYVHPQIPTFYYDAKNSELPAGNAVRKIDTLPPGDTWSDLSWMPADIQSILREGDVAAFNGSALRTAGYSLQAILTPLAS